jgi:hypothetical protein
MIRRDPDFDTFAEACSWPDRPRRRAVEHYVNLPRDAEGFTNDPCPLADECVVSAIEKDLAMLSSSSATEQERLEALKYLGHWVGDVHEPLHVSFEDDRGGNNVGVAGVSAAAIYMRSGTAASSTRPPGGTRTRSHGTLTRSPVSQMSTNNSGRSVAAPALSLCGRWKPLQGSPAGDVPGAPGGLHGAARA